MSMLYDACGLQKFTREPKVTTSIFYTIYWQKSGYISVEIGPCNPGVPYTFLETIGIIQYSCAFRPLVRFDLNLVEVQALREETCARALPTAVSGADGRRQAARTPAGLNVAIVLSKGKGEGYDMVMQ